MNIKGKQAILQKVVFELRYRYGMTYLDKCGRTLNAITREQPEWILKSAASAQNSGLVSMRNSCNFNFSGNMLDSSIEQPAGGEPLSAQDVAEFTEQTDILSRIVIDQLGLKDFTRVGFRCWYLFPCESQEESERWILELGYYDVSSKPRAAFNGEVDITNFTVIVASEDRKFRLALNGVENQAQLNLGQEILSVRASSLSHDQKAVLLEQMKVRHRILVNPAFAAMIDVDAFQDAPLSVDPGDFIKTSVDKIEKGLTASVK